MGMLAELKGRKVFRVATAYLEPYWREKGWPALCQPLGDDDFECGPAASEDVP